MTVNTKKVTGRRELHFNSLDEMLADAERLAAAPRLRALGNWTFPQAVLHLTRAIDGSIDGYGFSAPWIIRVVAPLFKKRLLTRPMSPGFRLPLRAATELIPVEPVDLDTAMAALRRSVARLKQEEKRGPNVVLGPLTRAEWDQLHARHAELHLSFFVPEGESL